jgi:hypothetical protein
LLSITIFAPGLKFLGQSQPACGGFAWGWILLNAGFNVDFMYWNIYNFLKIYIFLWSSTLGSNIPIGRSP